MGADGVVVGCWLGGCGVLVGCWLGADGVVIFGGTDVITACFLDTSLGNRVDLSTRSHFGLRPATQRKR